VKCKKKEEKKYNLRHLLKKKGEVKKGGKRRGGNKRKGRADHLHPPRKKEKKREWRN